ncbi:MAG: hypothetical protein KGL39_54555 [Patescibacteria group bacterium]|nr:hypothetical protein [Patescibacteria group bacterium]
MSKRDYTPEEKFNAVVHYYQHSNLKKLETDLGIPYTTARTWLEQEWWHDLMAKVIKDFDAEMRANGLAIIKKAQAEIMDRLENGDAVLTKTGAIIRKPAALRDILFTFLTTFDKNRIINQQPTSAGAGSLALAELKKQLEDIGNAVKGKTPEQQHTKELDLPMADEA